MKQWHAWVDEGRAPESGDLPEDVEWNAVRRFLTVAGGMREIPAIYVHALQPFGDRRLAALREFRRALIERDLDSVEGLLSVADEGDRARYAERTVPMFRGELETDHVDDALSILLTALSSESLRRFPQPLGGLARLATSDVTFAAKLLQVEPHQLLDGLPALPAADAGQVVALYCRRLWSAPHKDRESLAEPLANVLPALEETAKAPVRARLVDTPLDEGLKALKPIIERDPWVLPENLIERARATIATRPSMLDRHTIVSSEVEAAVLVLVSATRSGHTAAPDADELILTLIAPYAEIPTLEDELRLRALAYNTYALAPLLRELRPVRRDTVAAVGERVSALWAELLEADPDVFGHEGDKGAWVPVLLGLAIGGSGVGLDEPELAPARAALARWPCAAAYYVVALADDKWLKMDRSIGTGGRSFGPVPEELRGALEVLLNNALDEGAKRCRTTVEQALEALGARVSEPAATPSHPHVGDRA